MINVVPGTFFFVPGTFLCRGHFFVSQERVVETLCCGGWEKAEKITVFRDPVERVYSMYKFRLKEEPQQLLCFQRPLNERS